MGMSERIPFFFWKIFSTKTFAAPKIVRLTSPPHHWNAERRTPFHFGTTSPHPPLPSDPLVSPRVRFSVPHSAKECGKKECAFLTHCTLPDCTLSQIFFIRTPPTSTSLPLPGSGHHTDPQHHPKDLPPSFRGVECSAF